MTTPTPSPAPAPTPRTDACKEDRSVFNWQAPEYWCPASKMAEVELALTAATQRIAELEAWKQYAEGHGLHIALNKTTDCPE
jgi:hypothetical protein